MNILIEARSLLDGCGYRTMAISAATAFTFEDESVMGLVSEHKSVQELLSKWENTQDTFLGAHASTLRINPAKAWNIYTVHLTAEPPLNDVLSKLFAIEEDFRGTRKLARAGIQTKDDLRNALLSLLPIQSRVVLTKESHTERIRGRLVAVHPSLSLLFDDLSPQQVAKAILEWQE
jgi:hypothetical protein